MQQLHLRVVLAWGDAAQCCLARACHGGRTRGGWYLVVFMVYIKESGLSRLSPTYSQALRPKHLWEETSFLMKH